jgi:mevalonate kinase
MSAYVELMQLRKDALRNGNKKKAKEYMAAAQKLLKEGQVTSKDHLGAAYT